jgi:hemimethylated DNA binding protein
MTNNNNPKIKFEVGDHVESSHYGYVGVIKRIHTKCPESKNWLRNLEISCDEYVNKKWITLNLDCKGSVCIPYDTLILKLKRLK